jgi:hypothetical protein
VSSDKPLIIVVESDDGQVKVYKPDTPGYDEQCQAGIEAKARMAAEREIERLKRDRHEWKRKLAQMTKAMRTQRRDAYEQRAQVRKLCSDLDDRRLDLVAERTKRMIGLPLSKVDAEQVSCFHGFISHLEFNQDYEHMRDIRGGIIQSRAYNQRVRMDAMIGQRADLDQITGPVIIIRDEGEGS